MFVLTVGINTLAIEKPRYIAMFAETREYASSTLRRKRGGGRLSRTEGNIRNNPKVHGSLPAPGTKPSLEAN